MAISMVDTFPKQSLKSGQKTIATAGSAARVTTDPYEVITIKALAGNTGIVYVGNDGADDVTSSNGFELSAKEEITLYTSDKVYLDVAVNGEGVSFIILVQAGSAY